MAKTKGMRGWRAALLIAVISAAAITACGDDDDASEGRGGEDFEARLQSIVQTASAQYGELAERAGSLNPSKPVPDDFKQEMLEVAASDRDAADELEGLAPPQEAKDLLGELVAALHARADAFEAAAARQKVSLQQLEKDPALAEAGEQLERVLGQLREADFLSDNESHD